MKRLPSIDIARGLVMVIMALDHARDLLGYATLQNPLDLKTTTPILFFTRVVTHLCAPAFVFLSGVSAYLSLGSASASGVAAASGATLSGAFPSTVGASYAAGRRFLLKRGIVLVLVEFTLVNFALNFDIHFRVFIFEVIATIGAGMILLSFLSRLPSKAIFVIAFLLIFGHDLINRVPMPASPVLGFLGSLFFGPGAFKITPNCLLVIAYPVLPWLGIMLAGFASGQLFTLPVHRRRSILLRLGLSALALFAVLRFLNVYGDPNPWSAQKSAGYTFLSFLNVSKYPPSLLFTLITIGVLLIILSIAEEKDNVCTRILLTYGRVPLFYFILHLYLIHCILLLVVLLQGHRLADLPFGAFQFGRPEGAGLSLGAIYLVWIGVVVVLYPACRWYGKYKAAHKEMRWLRYL
jgi:uncharacterized membrane protein